MNKLKKMGFQIALLVSVVIALLGVIGYATADDVLKEQSLVSTPLLITYAMILLGVLLSIGLPLIKALKHPRTLISVGLSFGAVVLILVIAYIIASGVIPDSTDGTYIGITNSNMKLAGGLITTAVVLVMAGVVGLIGLEVKSLIKR